jgi:hypothetical protein
MLDLPNDGPDQPAASMLCASSFGEGVAQREG